MCRGVVWLRLRTLWWSRGRVVRRLERLRRQRVASRARRTGGPCLSTVAQGHPNPALPSFPPLPSITTLPADPSPTAQLALLS